MADLISVPKTSLRNNVLVTSQPSPPQGVEDEMLKDDGEMFEIFLESLHPNNESAPEVPGIGSVAAKNSCFHVP